MKLCMATVSLGGGLDEKIDAIAAAGFDGIELLDTDLRESSMSPADCARRCGDLGLTIDLYQPFRRAEGVSYKEFDDVLKRFHSELEVMRQLGADSILVVSNTDDDAEGSRDLSTTQVAALSDAAAEQGMTVMFEALAWGTHISSVVDAWDVVREADHPNLSLVVDTFHLLAGGEGVDTLDALPHGAVGFFQLADAPWLSMDLKQWSRNHRCFPGEGEMDLLPSTASVFASGYDGPLSLEIFNPGYRERSPHEVARVGAQSLEGLVSALRSLRPTANEAAAEFVSPDTIGIHS
ncbi:4-hydroxyphenylpyruvate dioxygenase [Williamsia limnetica]|uniref:4-hydroxyphenylpyruvate dioxygenase n=1 Tax=Williamsia limnetica TaxID=882452 RepID=A0A318RRX7_WILLI|nr:sugar phosphate isomerase/epimerase [Williamsia limnetica]PYE18176.1 4-hydroxyphenylpyruvate dioxygenase [Williamsia limnetica]